MVVGVDVVGTGEDEGTDVVAASVVEGDVVFGTGVKGTAVGTKVSGAKVAGAAVALLGGGARDSTANHT